MHADRHLATTAERGQSRTLGVTAKRVSE